MTPQQKLKTLNEIFVRQTGRTIDDLSDEELDVFMRTMKVRMNNEKILSDVLSELDEKDRYAVQMWRQVCPLGEIYERTGMDSAEVSRIVDGVIERLWKHHFPKFTRGWRVDVTGEPVAANPPVQINDVEAQNEFDKWMTVLALISP